MGLPSLEIAVSWGSRCLELPRQRCDGIGRSSHAALSSRTTSSDSKSAIKPPHCQSFKTVLHFFLCIPIPGLHPLRIDGGHMAKKAKKAKKTVAKKAKKAAKKK